MTYRVLQWGTGVVGTNALRSIILHPDYELIGLVVHSPDKVGRDAAEICGLPKPTGVLATADAEAGTLLDHQPDAVCYNAIGTGAADVARRNSAVDDIVGILERGLDVVSTSITSMVYPPMSDPGQRRAIDQACERGGATCFVSGVHPGFCTDVMPLVLSGVCTRIDAIDISEIISYETWVKSSKFTDHFGFGKAPDFEPPIFSRDVIIEIWGSVVGMLADELDVRLDDMRVSADRWVATQPLEAKAMTVELGTIAAVRFDVRGVVGGRPVLRIEHIYRAHRDAAPEWPQPPGVGGYRIRIDGDPAWTCDLALEGSDGVALTGGELATATRVVNAIPAVVAAPSGLLKATDLPLVNGRHRLA